MVTTRRSIDGLLQGLELDATVTTSEPILVSYRLTGEDGEHLIFKNASAFDSRFPETVSANPSGVELEVRDQFTIDEIMQRFVGRDMPCKFAIVSGNNKVLLCEFEG